MKTHDNTYSRLIAWLKVILPLMALAILSTLFLVSQKPGADAPLPYSDADVDEILREQSIVAPQYNGMTRDGAAITLSADVARPGSASGSGSDAQGLRVLVETPDGGNVRLNADTAALDMTDRLARLTGGVHIETSTGYALDSQAVTTALDITRIETEAPVTGTAPFGTLNAGRMLVRRDDDGATGTPYVLLFTDGVRLLYEPKADQGGQP
ncbi:LPS export ABC transporter periplasmic protein LptC [Oceaniglobus indicus]|uniref:LPS export ABC transporter periplasmic protein LptC n=1 Tax=Oceaniglobus indicus TaxID=2047749 RepID=UPI000C18B0BD|nr:LPS export ABC transporter periplasmic protein LptC [Oceaniglobus indicus]